MYRTDYELLNRQAKSLIKDVPYFISNLANLSALIYETLEDINWAGFYISEGDRLYLGPFQGKTACVEIPFGRGVCGTAAKENKTQLVADVHKFPGHIACDSASQSEIVVPVNHGRRVIGVLDIDSPVPARFSGEDKAGLEELVHILERELNKS